MSSFFPGDGIVAVNGAVSPFGTRYLTSAVPSGTPQVYTVVIGRKPEMVKIDVSNIHYQVVPVAVAAKKVERRPSSRRPTSSRRK